jgi:hypothetical protein
MQLVGFYYIIYQDARLAKHKKICGVSICWFWTEDLLAQDKADDFTFIH